MAWPRGWLAAWMDDSTERWSVASQTLPMRIAKGVWIRLRVVCTSEAYELSLQAALQKLSKKDPGTSGRL